ncbi:MAG TPA: YafY family protein [Clostridia bacterium]|nr:YafY family protein [Clostridia bacterium]
MKIDRLVAILVILLRKERVQAKELAEKFDVSVRTILRDVDAINLAGIPIVTYQGTNGGIGIAEGYRLDKSVLTGDEMAAVITTLKGIDGAITGKSHEVLMEKLKNALPSNQLELLNTKLNQFVIDLSPWRENADAKEKLALIRKAIEINREIEFVYMDSEGNTTERRVEPYTLLLKSQKWYLYAWCSIREDFRYFRISRMKALALGEKTFNPREASPGFVPEDREWEKFGSLIPLELLFSRHMENIVVEWFGEGAEKCDDGRIRVRTELPENNWLYGFLLSFGNELEVVSPPQIRITLSEIAKKIYEKYALQHDI